MFCPKCSAQNEDNAEICIKCGFDLKNPSEFLAKEGSKVASAVVPINRTALSIVAGYLGLFAIIPFFAPISLVVSIFALRDLKKHPEKLGKGRAIFGLIMGGVGTIILIYLFVA